MSGTLARIAVPIQVVGLAGAGLGLGLGLLSGSGANLSLGIPASIAVALDIVAARVRLGSVSIAAAIVRTLVAVFLPLMLFFGGSAGEIVRLVDPNVAYTVLAWSSLPSVVGAILRIFRR